MLVRKLIIWKWMPATVKVIDNDWWSSGPRGWQKLKI